MKLLCLDSSRASQSVAIYDMAGSELLATDCIYEADPKQQKETRQRRSSHYLPMLAELMQKANTEVNEISMIAVSVGPGSFTGVRTALTVAKTLANELDIKILAINNFELLRFENQLAAQDAVVLSAGKEDYFLSLDDDYHNPATNYFCDDISSMDLKADAFAEKNLSLIMTGYINELQADELLSRAEDYSQIQAYYLRSPSIGKIHPKAVK